MRKLGCLVGFVLLVAASAAAQQKTPQVELFGGYKLERFNPGGGFTGGNLNGWTGALTGNVNSWFGVTAEITGVYGKQNFGGTTGVDSDHHTVMFGPKFTYRDKEKWAPFAHTLFGFGRINGAHLGTTFGDEVGDTGFNWATGGGIDFVASPRISIRLVQIDVLYSRYDRPLGTQTSQTSLRLAWGINFRFGER